MFFLVHGNFEVGGSETFLLREALYLQKNNIPVTICCYSIVEQMKCIFEQNHISIRLFNGNISLQTFGQITDSDTVISVVSNHYMDTFLFLQKSKCKAKNCFYVVHPTLLTLHPYSKGDGHSRLVNKSMIKDFLFKSSFKKFVKKRMEFGDIFFMDEECMQSSLKYFDFDNTIREFSSVLPLPYEETTYSNSENLIRINELKNFNILTIARADFPFKKYILDLIDQFVNHFDFDPFQLTIVSYGDNYNAIKEKVLKSASERIILINGASYEELDEYYKKTAVYVGMGSTVIEASKNGVLAIAVKAYSDKCLSDDLFIKNPFKVTAEGKQETWQIIAYIYDEYRSDIEKFQDASSESISVFNSIYGMNSFNSYFLERKINYNSFAPRHNCYLEYYKITSRIKRLLDKNY